jgi:hypothetical protein
MLLIPTNSVDGTCDALVRILKETGQPFFRWNVDLWQHYETFFDGACFLFTDPTGRTVDATSTDVVLLWRKPFTDLMTFEALPLETADQALAKAQIGQWLQALTGLMKPEGRVRLVEPYADRRLPKLYQLWIAKNFFAMPRSCFSVNEQPSTFGPMMITKPLGDPSVGEQNIFYTQRIDGAQLFRPYPWFVQEALVEGRDITCVHILGHSHFYECDFLRGEEAIDWRVEINTENQSGWHPLQHPRLAEWVESVNGYMKLAGLHYGRLDFILQRDTLYFLECNSNGQFGWLDDVNTLALHREFLAAACSQSSVVS